MSYKLLTEVNNSANQHEKYIELIENLIDLFGFDRKEVICTEEQLDQFIANAADRPLLEYDERAAFARAGEREWLSDLEQEQKKKEVEQRRLGIEKGKVKPAEGQRVIMPGQGGIGQIVATDPQGGQVMVRDKGGREFVVKIGELVGPKMVGKQAAWMLRR